MKRKHTSIPITKETYWKLLELKAKFKCSTWDELIEKIYPILLEILKEKDDNSTGKTPNRK